MMRAEVQRALVGLNGSGPVLAGEDCAGCDTPMVITRDAIGRPRKRCPKCDGVSHNRRHPDEVLLPQGLVRAMPTLPPVLPGQLRCQRCAHGVEGRARFCADCHGKTKLKICSCGTRFRPARNQQRCDACLAAQRERSTITLCIGCNRTWPRKPRCRAVVGSCNECRGFYVKGPALRTCLGCGATSPRAPGTRVTVKTCDVCPRPPRRVAKSKPAPRVHPRDLPAGDPRKVEWLAKREATRAARGADSYKPRACKRDGCTTVFQPTGPAAKYCEAHR